MESLSQLGSLFSGFPQISEIREPILLAANGGQRSMKLTISVGFFSEERDQEGTRRLVPKQVERFSTGELLPALVIEAGAGRRIVPLKSCEDIIAGASCGRISSKGRDWRACSSAPTEASARRTLVLSGMRLRSPTAKRTW